MRMREGIDNEVLAKLRPSWVKKIRDDSGAEKIVADDPWSDLRGQEQQIVKATAKPGAFVNIFCQSDATAPYLARWNYGLGTVVWVAQDFGDREVVSVRVYAGRYWQAVWDRTPDWKNETIVL